jgi:hypothetical protein
MSHITPGSAGVGVGAGVGTLTWGAQTRAGALNWLHTKHQHHTYLPHPTPRQGGPSPLILGI